MEEVNRPRWLQVVHEETRNPTKGRVHDGIASGARIARAIGRISLGNIVGQIGCLFEPVHSARK